MSARARARRSLSRVSRTWAYTRVRSLPLHAQRAFVHSRVHTHSLVLTHTALHTQSRPFTPTLTQTHALTLPLTLTVLSQTHLWLNNLQWPETCRHLFPAEQRTRAVTTRGHTLAHHRGSSTRPPCGARATTCCPTQPVRWLRSDLSHRKSADGMCTPQPRHAQQRWVASTGVVIRRPVDLRPVRGKGMVPSRQTLGMWIERACRPGSGQALTVCIRCWALQGRGRRARREWVSGRTWRKEQDFSWA